MSKTLITFLLALFVGFPLSAQNRFESGTIYYKNSPSPINCKIEYLGWVNSPSSIQVLLENQTNPITLTSQEIEAFEVDKRGYYKSIDSDLPITQMNVKPRSTTKEPDLVRKSVFVKRITKGKASLYLYLNGQEKVFLVANSEDMKDPLPLLYKVYERDQVIYKNNIFRRQLLQYFNCESGQNIQSVEYSIPSLKGFISAYNKCSDPQNLFGNVDSNQKMKWQFSPLVGVGFYDLEVAVAGSSRDFGSQTVPTAGLEVEAILPFGSNHWSVFLNSTFSQFESDEVMPVTLTINKITNRLGIRYYAFLNDSNSIFFQPSIAYDINDWNYENDEGVGNLLPEFMDSSIGASIGIGYSYKQRLNISANLHLVDAVEQEPGRSSQGLNLFSILVGYAL